MHHRQQVLGHLLSPIQVVYSVLPKGDLRYHISALHIHAHAHNGDTALFIFSWACVCGLDDVVSLSIVLAAAY